MADTDETPAPREPPELRRASSLITRSRVERAHERMHGPMALLGVLFLVLVLTERLIRPREPISSILLVASWAIWAAFVLEFVLRLSAAPSATAFLRKYWWQLALLLLPFLNFLRILGVWRVGRLGRVLSAGLRGSRTARERLTGRVGWVASMTLIVILVAADLVYEFGGVRPYSSALYSAALATIDGEPIPGLSGAARVLNVALAAYSVVVFASLAATVGAFLVEKTAETPD